MVTIKDMALNLTRSIMGKRSLKFRRKAAD